MFTESLALMRIQVEEEKQYGTTNATRRSIENESVVGNSAKSVFSYRLMKKHQRQLTRSAKA
jgi:hypothetical protein